jgi:hypothetical protein
MSKFIPKSRITHQVNNYTWSNMNVDYSRVAEDDEDKTDFKSEKQRIETIPLEQLSFKDLYQFPFHQAKYGNWVYDKNSHFIFQFLAGKEEDRKEIVSILNGEKQTKISQEVTHKDGEILVDGVAIILIRNWGGLTGTGAYNLDGEYASKIQDSLAEFIVEKLSAKTIKTEER